MIYSYYENLLINANYELKNRYLHVDYNKVSNDREVFDNSKSKICTLDCTLEEKARANALKFLFCMDLVLLSATPQRFQRLAMTIMTATECFYVIANRKLYVITSSRRLRGNPWQSR